MLVAGVSVKVQPVKGQLALTELLAPKGLAAALGELVAAGKPTVVAARQNLVQ